MPFSKEGVGTSYSSRVLASNNNSKIRGNKSYLVIAALVSIVFLIFAVPLFLGYQLGFFSPQGEDNVNNPDGGVVIIDDALPMNEAVTLANCVTTSSLDSVTCDTNCQGETSQSATAVVMDSNGTIAIAKESTNPIPIGLISFTPGKVTFTPSHVELMGDLISSTLSELDGNTNDWSVSLSCGSPEGTAYSTGVSTI